MVDGRQHFSRDHAHHHSGQDSQRAHGFIDGDRGEHRSAARIETSPLREEASHLLSSPHRRTAIAGGDEGTSAAKAIARTDRSGDGANFLDIPPAFPTSYTVGERSNDVESTAKPLKIDATKSVEELIKTGVLKDASDRSSVSEPLAPGKAPQITVVYENRDESGAPPTQPDFIIDKQGNVQVVHNPESGPPDGNIIVQVAREAGETGAPAIAQQASIDGLVDYLGTRIRDKYAPFLDTVTSEDGTRIKQVDIVDLQNLVTDRIEQKFGNNLPPAEQPPIELPQSVQDLSDGVSRVGGSGGGSQTFDRSAIDGAVPARDVPPSLDNVPSVQAMENTAAALFNPDKEKPYETIKHVDGMGYRAGRYGLNYGLMAGWLAELLGIDLGEPPDLNKLKEFLKNNPDAMKLLGDKMQKLAGDKKVPQEFADKFNDPNFGKQFTGFVDKLAGKSGEISVDEVKTFLPKELQETIGQNRVEHYAREVGANPDNITPQEAGKIGLAMFLGRTPTPSDLSNPQYQKYIETSQNFYQLARAGQFGSGDITAEGKAGDILAASAADVGKQMWAVSSQRGAADGGRLGCALSVTEVLQQAGINVPDAAGAAWTAHWLRDHGWQVKPATAANLTPGAVIFGTEGGSFESTIAGGNSHIGIVGENTNGQWWIYDNSSKSTLWSHRPIQQTSFVFGNQRFGDDIYVLIPPA